MLMEYDPGLSKKLGLFNAAPVKGYTEGVNELLLKDHSLPEMAGSNGKKDPQHARRANKKWQTALHTAVKVTIREAVKLLLEADAARNHKTALHMAEGLPLSEEICEMRDCLSRCGAARANE
ncbi:hypothetical protein SAY87_009061 [Trapa incisa]|uniref:Uncharacterized protein n=1 Tax=Trapa incisa TaxID=236973 RepID=A0AAN7JXH5_9MYRT|nr:hypothetical protein SAY87_009061 [Trapa incisa]